MRALGICVLVALVGCAQSPPPGERRPATVGTTDTGPVLLGCPYTEAIDPATAPIKVTLRYRVQADGSVDPSSIVVRSSHHMTDDRQWVERAREIARGCTYDPAVENGRPVEAVVRKRFNFAG